MTVFVSYSRKDQEVVNSLIDDIKRCGQQPWLDDQLRGGEDWWQEILRQIRASGAFVFCLSDNAMHSKPCQAELGYAKQLGLPIIPVQVGTVSSMRAFPLADIQAIDYRTRSSAAGLDLSFALQNALARPVRLPSPLPPPPPLPFAYLLRLRSQIEAPQMDPIAQDQARMDLLNALSQEDTNVHPDILELIRELRRRGDVTYRTAEELDRVLTSVGAAGEQARPTGPSRPAPPTVQAPVPWPSPPPVTTPPRRRSRAGLVVVLCLLALLGAGGAIYAATRSAGRSSDWTTAANGICRQADQALSPLVSSTPAPGSQALPLVAQVFRTMDQSLRNLAAPTDVQSRIVLMTSEWDHVADSYDQIAQAITVGDGAAIQTANAQQSASNARGNQIADELGLSPCAGVGTGTNIDFTR